MKKLYILSALFLFAAGAQAQEFNKGLADARASYASGKLDDARFSMQQMLQDLDLLTGKEILKRLPAKMQDMAAVTTKDNVSGTSGFLGVVIHREYGTADKNIALEIITNSPMITGINALLAIPLIGNSAENKVIRIGGYKALVQKVTGDNNSSDYELQLPLNNTLITLKAPGHTQDEVIKMANTIPVAEIAKLIQ